MLHIYGTVYNNANRVKQSIDSIMKINVEKSIYIIDNYSTDGTYEILKEVSKKIPNIYIKREKCSRGKGRQLAMEMAKDKADDNDLFMTFDLDTIYTENFIKAIEWGVKNIGKKDIFINFLCYKNTNFEVPWRDLNYGEDIERLAHFCYLGYNYLSLDKKIRLNFNEEVGYNREKRYSSGFSYYKRLLNNSVDLFIGWGIDNFKKYKKYLYFIKDKVTRKKYVYLSIVLFLIFVYIKIFRETYSYSDEINRIYINSKVKIVDIFQSANYE
ncbi:MAG: glycosyltransferase family A protein [Thermoplasmatales archaeon]